MQHVIDFTIQEDPANGEWGFYPDSAIGHDFNTSWMPHMLFHDIFEHWFEDTGYFSGNAAWNIGGEVAAMGAMSYYLFCLGIDNRARTPQWSNQRYIDHVGVVETTSGEMIDGIIGYGVHYGNRLECNVPLGVSVDNWNLDSIIAEHWAEIQTTRAKKGDFDGVAYKKSITESKLRRLYSQGWKMAESLVPDNEENRQVLNEFLYWWARFFKVNTEPTEFSWMRFTVDKENDVIFWTCEVSHMYGNFTIDSRNLPGVYIEDLIPFEEEEYA